MTMLLRVFALLAAVVFPVRAQDFGPPELIERAKAEGRIMLYSVNFTETEQAWIAGFNKRFPFVKVDMIRAPGGQLITRIRSEHASGKLTADVIDYSDRGHLAQMLDMYREYRPPNADDFEPSAVTDPAKIWPRTTTGWCIAYNTELVKVAPTSFKDLLDPKWKGKQIAQVLAGAGGPPWSRAMFERQVVAEDFWARVAAQDTLLFPSGAPATDSIVRGETKIGAQQTNIVIPRMKDGAPLGCAVPSEGVPFTSTGAGILKSAKNVAAATLFLNWTLSREGQETFVRESGGFSALKAKLVPDALGASTIKPWFPNMADYVNLQAAWFEEWNKLHGHRQ